MGLVAIEFLGLKKKCFLEEEKGEEEDEGERRMKEIGWGWTEDGHVQKRNA